MLLNFSSFDGSTCPNFGYTSPPISFCSCQGPQLLKGLQTNSPTTIQNVCQDSYVILRRPFPQPKVGKMTPTIPLFPKLLSSHPLPMPSLSLIFPMHEALLHISFRLLHLCVASVFQMSYLLYI